MKSLADVCYFELKAVGKPVNLWELIDLMQRKNAYEKNGIRWIKFETEPKVSKENDEEAYISGSCRWSVHSSMINKWSDEFHTLLSATKMLNLTVEVYSVGSGFQEHYIIQQGQIIQEDDAECWEYCVSEMSTEELCECIKDNQLDGKAFLKYLDEETLTIGGFDHWDFSIGGI